MIYTSKSLEETEEIAMEFLKGISPKTTYATVVGLYGNLGAGKTAFTKAVAKVLGVPDTVTSPTFVIMKAYELSHFDTFTPSTLTFDFLVHIDAYRLEKEEELLHLGWKEIISDPSNLIFIEWPERVSGIIPDHIKIKFDTLPNENSREIEIIV
ncbi:MAG: tRNA (adenosine(37)-N6)-threonylcarbamoyltransferase complex ATPase subunit type 1 TsaE [Minisyncoccia bacterium]